MDKGWIKLHRKIFDCPVWNNNEPFDKRSAWIDLLLSASHKDVKLLFGTKTVVICRGSFMFSIEKLCDRWSWSRNKVKRFLNLLEREQMVTTERTTQGTLIKIVNYDSFQADGNVEALDKPEKVEKEKAKAKTTFAPPTLTDVVAYCNERNNKVNAQSFIDFYESKGWMIGKNKMKDWKAAVRTWEKNDKKTNGTGDRDILSEWRCS